MEKTNCGETNDVIDRISNLPDAIGAHILSFLSTKEAVWTCMLSKRWKSTWACVPVLDINFEEFGGRTYDERKAKFERFVNGVLRNRESSNLEKFKLVWYTERYGYANSKALESCILQAMKFKPQVLSLSVRNQILIRFGTHPIFTCASLHDLMLEQNVKYIYEKIAFSSVQLQCLKKLHLTRMIVNDDFVEKLFFGCPILEDLFLHNCILDVYEISNGKLKKVVILECFLEQSLKISTPILLELEVSGHCCCMDMCPLSWINMLLITFSWETMASLMNARFEFPDFCYSTELPDLGGFKFSSLSYITTLDLRLPDSRLRELLEKEVLNCPIFNNLKKLILGGWCMSHYFELVAFFLRSPYLQRLTLYNHYDILSLLWDMEEDTDKRSSQEEARDALFQREQLEIVKIIKSSKYECVEQLVNKLHAHVKTIGKIIII